MGEEIKGWKKKKLLLQLVMLNAKSRCIKYASGRGRDLLYSLLNRDENVGGKKTDLRRLWSTDTLHKSTARG